MPLLNRRDFLRTGLAGSLVLSTTLRAADSPPASRNTTRSGRAKNIIFLVSDGMSLGTLTLAERYLRRHKNRGTRWLGLYDRPDVRRSLMDTSSASSLVTDSAAASSAWGCGHKVKNGSINITPDGLPRPTILQLAREAGRATGLVTTATITHATPAGFAANTAFRGDEAEIATQYLDRRIDVLLGGGTKFFDPSRRKDGRDLFADFRREGYHVARDRAALQNTPADGRLLGVFTEGYLPYDLDHRADDALIASVPRLPEMTRAALDRLSRHEGGFVLQIEGARVDHAAHANDIGGLLHDQLALDEAVGIALDFVANRDDTLVIVASDHGNANPGLNGSGGNFDSRGGSYGDTGKCFERIAEISRTNSWTLSGLNADSTSAQIRARVAEGTGITLIDDEIDLLGRALRKDPSPREGYRVRNSPMITLAQIMANYTSVGWTGVAHTTDHVELAAFGPGSESIRGMVQNTALFGVMTRALGIAAPTSV